MEQAASSLVLALTQGQRGLRKGRCPLPSLHSSKSTGEFRGAVGSAETEGNLDCEDVVRAELSWLGWVCHD
jgi:hypothetical protein